jgi:hypothetical protein
VKRPAVQMYSYLGTIMGKLGRTACRIEPPINDMLLDVSGNPSELLHVLEREDILVLVIITHSCDLRIITVK